MKSERRTGRYRTASCTAPWSTCRAEPFLLVCIVSVNSFYLLDAVVGWGKDCYGSNLTVAVLADR